MSYEDRISIATPEGIDLDVTLAGLGSRFVAALLDQLIQGAVLLALLLLGLAGFGFGDLGGGGDSAALLFGAAMVLVFFLVQFGYHILFETRAGGRTPGKRWAGLRVVRAGGGPVTFTASAIRNVVRLIDMLPGAYAVGIVAILATSRNQRLGDMAAGTLVIRERTGETVKPVAPWLRPEVRLEPSEQARTWDASAVTADEVAAVRRFLDRRATLTDEPRARLAAELARRLRPKVVGPHGDMHPEDFLLDLAAVKATRG